MFRRILVANRGEIACRVIRTAKAMGIETVAVFSDADANTLHVEMADEAIHIGGALPAESYLDIARVLAAAKQTRSEAIHPGYGFLSENAEFAERCEQSGVTFIGPPTNAINVMGSKSAAKRVMADAGVPLLPGYHGADQDDEVLRQAAAQVGYPVLLKASAGGGGKGMRQVHNENEFTEALAAARREAISSFGNGDMLVEKYLTEPRHVEIQVFCDRHGNGVYLFERDCSIQRRHQKIIEEAPAPGMTGNLRQSMGNAAVRAAQAVDYVGAGTVEFLLDVDGSFYFMEMNTRLQVEHPVTEMITGLDLVEWQLRVANGEPLPVVQQDLTINGHAIEARIYAEDPESEFLPSSGTLVRLDTPTISAHVRIDSGVRAGDEIGTYYDPMLAKLITWGENRDSAINRMIAALREYRVVGVTTNIDFLARVCDSEPFRAARLSTRFLEDNARVLSTDATREGHRSLILAALYQALRLQAASVSNPWSANDYWRPNGPREHVQWFLSGEEEVCVTVLQTGDNDYIVSQGNSQHNVTARLNGEVLVATLDGHRITADIIEAGGSLIVYTRQGRTILKPGYTEHITDEVIRTDAGFAAPMNGRIVDTVSAGTVAKAGDTLVIMEAMKMEHAIKAPTHGRVTEVFFSVGELVSGGAELLNFEPGDPSDE